MAPIGATQRATLGQAGGLPDKGDLHARYDATKLSLSDGDAVSTWPDIANSYDLSAGTAPTYRTSIINGNPIVRFDGTDDFLEAAFAVLEQPNQIFMVYKIRSTSINVYFYDGDDSNADRNIYGGNDSGGWRMFAGAFVEGGTLDTQPHIANSLFNGASSKTDLDGSNVISGDAGTQGLEGFNVGGHGGDAPIDVGEILIYPQDKSAVEDDVEQYLSDKWGIAI